MSHRIQRYADHQTKTNRKHRSPKCTKHEGKEKRTILVPYSIACSVWKVPFLPVMPWQMTRVFLSTKTAGGGGEEVKWRIWEEEEEDDEEGGNEGDEDALARDANAPISFNTACRPIVHTDDIHRFNVQPFWLARFLPDLLVVHQTLTAPSWRRLFS